MNKRSWKATATAFAAIGLMVWLCLACMVRPVLADDSVTREIEAPVQKAIDTRQATQEAREQWDEEREQLTAVYDRLKAENNQLRAERERLTSQAAKQAEVNRGLAAEKAGAEIIQAEMLPHLKAVLTRMDRLIETDAPFLGQERRTRLSKLSAILDDPGITVAEKYRKTMEALFIEAEYGNTVEVYQERIVLDGTEVLGNIFRLGRVSLFFLSLDRETSAVFNLALNGWSPLGHEASQAIAGAAAMAAKHRPMEVISLPIGRLAGDTGGDHVE